MKTNGGKPCKIYVTGQWAFVPVEKGTIHKTTILYVKVPSCVVYVDCPNSRCGAKAGERFKQSLNVDPSLFLVASV